MRRGSYGHSFELDGSTGPAGGLFDELELAVDANELKEPFDLGGAADDGKSPAGPPDATVRRDQEVRAAGVHEVERPEVEDDEVGVGFGASQRAVKLGHRSDVQFTVHRQTHGVLGL